MTDKDKEVLFPVAGLNVATEFGRQPQQTTPLGTNVRAYDALQKRGRGGSRSGLSKFISDTVPAGAHLIQHLNVVVDPQAPALLAGGDVFGTTFPDPDARWSGRPVRVGGDAITPNRNLQRQPQSANVQIVEGIGGQDDDSSNPLSSTRTFTNPVPAGHIVVVFAACNGATGNENTLTVTNGAGTAYTKVASSDVLVIFTDPPNNPTVSTMAAYSFLSTGATEDKTVVVESSDSGEMEFSAIHIKFQKAILPIGTPTVVAQPGASGDPDLGTVDFGTVVTDEANCLVLAAARLVPRNTNLLDPNGGFAVVPNSLQQNLFVFSKSVALGGSLNPTATKVVATTAFVCYETVALFLRSA